METIRILDEDTVIVNEVINQEKALSKPNTSCDSKAEDVNWTSEDIIACHNFLEDQRQMILSLPALQPITSKEPILDSSSCDYPSKLSVSETEIQPTGTISRILDSPRSSNGGSQSDHLNRSNMYMKRKTVPQWTEQVRVCSGTGLEGALEDGYSWTKYGRKDILGAKYPRNYYRCVHKDQGCQATKQVQRSEDDPSIFEVNYRGQHTCISASHPTPGLASPNELNLNGLQDIEFFNSQEVIDEITIDTLQLSPNQDLPPPNEQNRSQNKQEILSHSNSKGCATTNPGTQSSQFQNQSETSKSKAETILTDMITRDASTPSTDPPQSNPEVEVGISYGKAIAPNLVTGDFSSAANTPSTGSPQHNPEVEVGISCGNVIAPNVVIDDITSAASTPLIGPPQSNPGVEEGNSCGKEVAPNVVTGDISTAASPPTGSPRSNPEVKIGIMGDITGAASTPSKGSPQHNPEVEVGISCGNIIAPNAMRGGFHNHIDDQDKQVQSSNADQTQFNSEILQVSETGTNVVVITDETKERKMDGKGKGSDSTNPRIESKPKSRHCCWFRCFCRCHCHIGVME